MQLCGDAHLSNFGVFASPERSLVFDINDFDETLPGPFEWDVKRLAASFAIGGRDLGFKEKDRRAAVAVLVAAYRQETRRLLDAHDRRLVRAARRRGSSSSTAPRPSAGSSRTTTRRSRKRRASNSCGRSPKLTHSVDGEAARRSHPSKTSSRGPSSSINRFVISFALAPLKTSSTGTINGGSLMMRSSPLTEW